MAKKKKNKVLIVFLVVLILIVCAAGGIYFGISQFFRTHFYPGTTVNGMNVSLADQDTVTEKLREESEDYILAVHDRDGNVSYINAEDIDYKYVEDDSVSGLLESQDVLRWPMVIRDSHSYEVECQTTYDEDKLISAIEGMSCFDKDNITAPQDAYLEYDDGEYTIVDEVEGNTPLEEQIILDVEQAIAEGQSVLELDQDDYEQPAVRADDPSLTEKLELVEKYRDMSVTYDIEGYEEVLDGDTIMSWITVNEDFTITIDENKVAAYAQKLASTYNTYAAKREFVTTKGDTITIGGGDYGWIISKSGEAEQLIEDIKGGKSVEREPVWEQKAFVGGTDDIGDTYVEIDYTNQHLYYYVDGELKLESDIVSGNLNNGNGSPDGVFKIITKKSPATLVGEDYSSDVTYFMPFAYNVGLHDASWRSSFGGSIYKGNGSHGCVNMPADKAKKLYKIIEIGTPVVAYYREDVSLTSNNAKVSNAYSYSGD